MRLIKEQKGVITLEATISLTIFVFAISAILSLANYARVQSIIQYALNQTAKEISQYSYIYAKSGLKDKDDKFRNDANAFKTQIDGTVDTLVDLTDAIYKSGENIGSAPSKIASGSLDEFIEVINSTSEDVDDILSKSEVAYASFKDFLSNPQALVKGFSAIALNEGMSVVKSRIIAPALSRAIIGKYINTNGNDVDRTLKRLGIEKGLAGLNFSMSTLLDDGQSINITVAYTVKSLYIPSFILKDQNYIQTASTAAWLGKALVIPEKDSLWQLPDFQRGQYIIMDLRANRSDTAVAPGYKFDFYKETSENSCEIQLTQSMNPLLDSYKDNDSAVKSKMRKAASTLIEAAKIDKVTMMTNVTMTIPKNKTYVVEFVIPEDPAQRERLKGIADQLKAEFPNVTFVINSDYGKHIPRDKE